MNKFKVGDKVRRIHNPNPESSLPIGSTYIVRGISSGGFLALDGGFEGWYEHFELVRPAEGSLPTVDTATLLSMYEINANCYTAVAGNDTWGDHFLHSMKRIEAVLLQGVPDYED